MSNNLGIYIHIPFCEKKCNYCDFYSSYADASLKERYVMALLREIGRWGNSLCRPADSLYLGGGTPSLLPQKSLCEIYDAVLTCFGTPKSATMEVNPDDTVDFAALPFNRISVGVQTFNDRELEALGRRHTALQAKQTLKNAVSIVGDVSADLMLGIPYQTKESLMQNLKTLVDLGVTHISAYMLKREKGTPFYKSDLPFADEDTVARFYLLTCEFLENNGFERYEISNFAKKGYESKHNLKYWTGEDYLGLGPAAHSKIGNRRFYYERDTQKYIDSPCEITESEESDADEEIMLLLRTNIGYDFSKNSELAPFLRRLETEGLIKTKGTRTVLTDRGALLSNEIITQILLKK
ncbi:MAG: radical SAM family heme chaperone HemW [Oscillospiraceae bacterium]|nr:radical SAM family heme chaperone HemW [Candidatus Equicaccousia limihippi]